jgi:hypothetical protein
MLRLVTRSLIVATGVHELNISGLSAWAQESEGVGANAYFISPADGETVSSPVEVVFGLSGMGVAPAGVAFPNSGHHHLLIDVDTMPPMDQPLPANDNVRHFGLGQTEVSIELSPGQHTLQMIVGDLLHTPHDTPVVSEKITITVSE